MARGSDPRRIGFLDGGQGVAVEDPAGDGELICAVLGVVCGVSLGFVRERLR